MPSLFKSKNDSGSYSDDAYSSADELQSGPSLVSDAESSGDDDDLEAGSPVEPHAEVERTSRGRMNQAPGGSNTQITNSAKGTRKPKASQKTETRSSGNSDSDQREPITAVVSPPPVASIRRKNQIAGPNPQIANSDESTQSSKRNGETDASQETKPRRTTGRKKVNLEDQKSATEGPKAKKSEGAAKRTRTTPQPTKKNTTTGGSKGTAKTSKPNPKARGTKNKTNTDNAAGEPDLAGFTFRKLLNSVPLSKAQTSLWGDDPNYDELVQKVGTFWMGFNIVLVELILRRREEQR